MSIIITNNLGGVKIDNTDYIPNIHYSNKF